jgi:hypothetical protein
MNSLRDHVRGMLRSFRHAPWQTLRRRVFRPGASPPPPTPTTSSDYPQWLENRIRERATRFTTPASPGQFSFLTGVYERTPVDVFRETASSVQSQTSKEFEWIILAHGPISPALDDALKQLSSDARIRIVRLPQNLGIMGGMRRCLEESSGRYVVPLDADDLLTADALTVLASSLLSRGNPAFIYSDEDSLVDGRPRSPYFRPDWDPLLNLSSSYIFHLVTFDRQIALDLGVYSDAAANYCHDWDTVFRFIGAGQTPAHVAEVLYHWRAHAASHTNTAEPHQGSLQSQRHVLERFLANRADGSLFEIKPFPIFRGAQEWWLSRRHVEPMTIEQIVLPGNARSLAEMVDRCSAPLVIMRHEVVQPSGDAWRWEAQGLFELHADMDLIAGRIINPDGVVLGGPDRVDAEGNVACPYRGMFAHEPGDMALALKPHTVESVNGAFFAARTAFLRQALMRLPLDRVTLPYLGAWLARLTQKSGRRIGYSPLLSADARPGFDCIPTPSADERAAFLAFG